MSEYKLEVLFDESHVNSFRELAKIIRDNWPALYIRIEGLGVGYNPLDIKHKCSECTTAMFNAALSVKPPKEITDVASGSTGSSG